VPNRVIFGNNIMQNKTFQVIEEGSLTQKEISSFEFARIQMCRNKDFKDPYFEFDNIQMCRNKDYKDPYFEHNVVEIRVA
jgi:hypothetical protein